MKGGRQNDWEHGQSHVLREDQLEELQILELNIILEGLENALTHTGFVDVAAFLTEWK